MAVMLEFTCRYCLINPKRSSWKMLADKSCKVLQCCVSTLVSLCRHRLFCLSYQPSASKSVVQLGLVQYYILRVAHILYVLRRVKPILYCQGRVKQKDKRGRGKSKTGVVDVCLAALTTAAFLIFQPGCPLTPASPPFGHKR